MKNEVIIRSTGFIHSYGFFNWIAQGMLPFKEHKAKAATLLSGLGLEDDIVKSILKGQYEYCPLNDKGDCLIRWN